MDLQENLYLLLFLLVASYFINYFLSFNRITTFDHDFPPQKNTTLGMKRYERQTNLSGGTKVCRGAAGTRVRQGSARTAAHWGGRSSPSWGLWDAGGLP